MSFSQKYRSSAQRGASMVEYALLVVAICIVAIPAVQLFGKTTTSKLEPTPLLREECIARGGSFDEDSKDCS